jgi:RimJ/RimL family protein N-acetyltransferase
VLETDRLLLRLPEPHDAEAMLEAVSDPEVMRYIGCGETGGREQAEAQIERMRRAWEVDGFGRFVAGRREDGSFLGRVGLLAWNPSTWENGFRAEIGETAELELGWTLVRRAWGSGYATEAARAVAAWAWGEVAPRRLISLIHPDNHPSKRVAAKLGERCEGQVTTIHGAVAELWALERFTETAHVAQTAAMKST